MRQSQQHPPEEKGEAQDPDPDVEARQDFWSIVGVYTYRNHVAPRTTKLYAPKDDFPIPLNYIDVLRQTKTSIDVLHETTIDDHWNVDGDTSLSEPWIGVRVQRGLTKTQVTTRPGNIYLTGRTVKHVEKLLAHSHKEMGRRRIQIERSKEQRGIHCVLDGDPDYEEIM